MKKIKNVGGNTKHILDHAIPFTQPTMTFPPTLVNLASAKNENYHLSEEHTSLTQKLIQCQHTSRANSATNRHLYPNIHKGENLHKTMQTHS